MADWPSSGAVRFDWHCFIRINTVHESVTQDLGTYHIRTNAANKAKSVFRVTGLKILGWVGTHIFIYLFFHLKKKYNFLHFERHFAFKLHTILFFPET